MANHMSWVDALFLIASTHRSIRFVMHQKMYRIWWIYPFARMLRCIPIASEMNPRELVASLNEASQTIRDGELVCIFAEGQIGHFGQVLPFRRGLNRILKGVDAPIIPVHLDNVWGSIFSFSGGRFYFKLPRQIPYPVTVSYGTELPGSTSPGGVRKAVIDLSADAWKERKRRIPALSRAIIQTSRRYPRRIAMTDESGEKIRFRKAFLETIRYCRQLGPVCEGDKRVGVFLPNSVQGTLVNWCLLMQGRVPVNLHESLDSQSVQGILRQSGVGTILTNAEGRSHLAGLSDVRVQTVEDSLRVPGILARLRDTALARFCPTGLLERYLHAGGGRVHLDDLATISMTRGRSGNPRCVGLSHYNVVSNALQLNQVFDFENHDSQLGAIPGSHPLGFGTCIVFPAVLGMTTHYCSSAEDARTVGRLTHEQQITLLFTSPRLIRMYLKGCEGRQFGSLRKVLIGGEKPDPDLVSEFEEKFGLRPLEAYGCAECSPVVSVNTTDFRSAGIRQAGSRRGSAGLILPGMTCKITDRNGSDLGFGEAGTLCVRGPNVMLGYLGEDGNLEMRQESDWLETGDTASLDESGFLFIEG